MPLPLFFPLSHVPSDALAISCFRAVFGVPGGVEPTGVSRAYELAAMARRGEVRSEDPSTTLVPP